MGDGLALWFVAINLNGLAMFSVDPLHSEEACIMAAREAGIARFECVDVPIEALYPPGSVEGSS